MIAEKGAGLETQAGTWLELISTAVNAYGLAQHQDKWQDRFIEALNVCDDGFWSKSFSVAPEETATLLSKELDLLIRVMGPDVDSFVIDNIPELSHRAVGHLQDLDRLHQQMDRLLPVDLAIVRAVMVIDKQQTLRRVKVEVSPNIELLNPWQQTLIDKLNLDSSESHTELFPFSELLCNSNSQDNAAGQLQKTIFTAQAQRINLDDSLQWIAVRDYLEEIEIVAGMIQQQLRESPQLSFADIGILLPTDAARSQTVLDLFTDAGLPVSGIAIRQQQRDLGYEVIYNLLQMLRKPAPTMAMAAFVTSPLLPWSIHEGYSLAAAFMRGNYDLTKAQVATSRGERLLKMIHKGVTTSADLNRFLDKFATFLTKDTTRQFHVDRAQELCIQLGFSLCAAATIPWETLFKQATPRPSLSEEVSGSTREGIAVFYEHEEPWRTVQTLYVLGFNEGHYPVDLKPSSVFTPEDITALHSSGLAIATNPDKSDSLRQLLRRQLSAATKNINFIFSRRDEYGKAHGASSSLSFMAQLFGHASDPENLVLGIGSVSDRTKIKGLAHAAAQHAQQPRLPDVANLTFGCNLLEIFRRHDGSVKPQSPSRLEVLMTSPLAWLLNQADLEPKEWHADTLDIMAKGTLAHGVFENIFAPHKPLPTQQDIPDLVAKYLTQVMSNTFPLLNRPEWRVERYHLQREIEDAALRWNEILKALNATVVGAETWLQGNLNGQPIHGTADLILQLANKKICVVDYKKSSSKKRKIRMEKGYDCQTGLYRIMLQTGGVMHKDNDAPSVHIEPTSVAGGMYYLMNDQIALADTDNSFKHPELVTELGTNTCVNAMKLIHQRLQEVAVGYILLNSTSDEAWYEKNAGMPLYHLDNSPLLRMFMHPEAQEV